MKRWDRPHWYQRESGWNPDGYLSFKNDGDESVRLTPGRVPEREPGVVRSHARQGVPTDSSPTVIEDVLQAGASGALDIAWRDAEVARAGIGILALRRHLASDGDYRATWYRPVDDTGGGTVIAETGPTPEAALRALAARLAAEPPETTT